MRRFEDVTEGLLFLSERMPTTMVDVTVPVPCGTYCFEGVAREVAAWKIIRAYHPGRSLTVLPPKGGRRWQFIVERA